MRNELECRLFVSRARWNAEAALDCLKPQGNVGYALQLLERAVRALTLAQEELEDGNVVVKPELAERIETAWREGRISENERMRLHHWRWVNIPACLGGYNPDIRDCERQDNEACRLCKKLHYACPSRR